MRAENPAELSCPCRSGFSPTRQPKGRPTDCRAATLLAETVFCHCDREERGGKQSTSQTTRRTLGARAAGPHLHNIALANKLPSHYATSGKIGLEASVVTLRASPPTAHSLPDY